MLNKYPPPDRLNQTTIENKLKSTSSFNLKKTEKAIEIQFWIVILSSQ